MKPPIVIPWSGNVPGYGDCRPDGRYAVNVVGTGIVTDAGVIPSPDPAGADYIRLPAAGPRIACQGQSTGRCHQWNGSAWEDLAPAYGPHAVIYDAGDHLHVCSTNDEYQQFGGYRYIDQNLNIVGVIQSNGTAAEGIREYTDCADFRVGQGQDGGAVLEFHDDRIRRLLLPGDARFITARQVGPNVAICVVNDDAHTTTLLFATVAELRALPQVTVSQQPPPVQPPPVQPPPEKPPVSFPNHLDVVQRERAKFSQATLTEEQCFTVTNAVASDPSVKADGWGLTKAPAGGSGFVVNGQAYRLDKLCHPSGYINDILSDTPGAAGAQWGPNADSNGNAANWAPAVALSAPPAQPPVDPPSPPPAQPPAAVDLSPVLNELAEMRAAQAALQAAVMAFVSQVAQAQQGMWGTVAIPYLGSARVDLQPGTRPQGK